ncbi:MAG: hypothetical protein ACOX5G_10920 [Kiritimatiellia bacterium]|jgi:hypothetical protein
MRFVLATQQHDAALRRLARDEGMPGPIRLAYTREPDWFAGQAALGHFQQTVVGLDAQGEVAASGVRALRRVFVNGEPREIGYLAGLRSLPRVRGGLGLAQGFRFVRALHKADNRVPAYLTTIIESNTLARTQLVGGRAGLPAYHDLGRIYTRPWLRLPSPRARLPAGVTLRQAPTPPPGDLLAFLRNEGAKRQFFPVLDEASFSGNPWCQFNSGGFCLAMRGNEIIGVAGYWDQRAFRQLHVTGYAPFLAALRPAFNGLARLVGRHALPALPPAGRVLDVCFATCVCVRDNDPVIFDALMRHLCRRARDGGHGLLLVSLHERSPLNAAFSRPEQFLECRSRLYCACWEDGEPFVGALEPARIPHVDGAML